MEIPPEKYPSVRLSPPQGRTLTLLLITLENIVRNGQIILEITR